MANKKTCNLCGEPLSLILLGKNRFPVYTHRGEQLKVCQALKLKRNVMKELVETIQKVGNKGPVKIERKKDGEVKIFGEAD